MFIGNNLNFDVARFNTISFDEDISRIEGTGAKFKVLCYISAIIHPTMEFKLGLKTTFVQVETLPS